MLCSISYEKQVITNIYTFGQSFVNIKNGTRDILRRSYCKNWLNLG